MILAHLGPIEHGVEGSDLVDLHGSHVEDLGDFVHGGEGQEVVVLLLGNEQDRDAGRLFVVGRVLLEELIDLLVVLRGELEWSLLIVVLRVTMIREC